MKRYVYAMANIWPQKSGQPFQLWVDCSGKDRNTTHNELRVKAEANNIEIVVGFKQGQYTTFNTTKKKLEAFKESKALEQYLIKMYPALLLHWNREIDDTDFGMIVRYVKRGMSVDDAIQKIYDERDEDE